MELIPLRLNNQIEDAIDNTTPPELTSKIETCKQNINRIVRINKENVFNVEVNGGDLFYTLIKDSNNIYYYPIQYARVMIV